MTRTLFTALIVLVLAVSAGWLLQHFNDGVVLFTYDGWIIQTSPVFFSLAVVALFLAAHLLLRLAGKLRRLPADLNRWAEHRRRRRSEKFLSRGLLSAMAGDWTQAERAFHQGAACAAAPLANYLGAAWAARQQGDAGGNDRYLRLAHQHDKTDAPALALTQARLQMERQQVKQAYDALTALNRRQPGHGRIKVALLETAVRLEDWTRATELLQECKRTGALPAEQVQAKQLSCYAGLLRQAGAERGRAALEQTWRDIPGSLKKELFLVETYVMECLRCADRGDCEALLRRALDRKWDAALVRLYGLVDSGNPEQQLAVAEKFLARFPEDAALLLTLGRLYKRNRLWGKARSCLEHSIAVQPNPEACQELAMLLEEQGDSAAAARYYQEGLGIATGLPLGGAAARSGAGQ